MKACRFKLYLKNCPTQLVVIVKVENHTAVLESPFTRWIPEMESAGMESSFNQLTARQGHCA